MDEIDQIARCMAVYQNNPEIQLVQTRFRTQLVDAWGIQPGERVLEIGCGQGDLTAALAYAVGAQGHVEALDPAPPDYGAPITVGDSQAFLKRSELGAQITCRLNTDVLDESVQFGEDDFDAVVFAHCTWYFDSLERIRRTLARVRPWAKRLCFSEWDLLLEEPGQLAHALAVMIQGQVEAFRSDSSANIRTPYTRQTLLDLAAEAGWKPVRVDTIDSSYLQDGGWEINGGCGDAVKSAQELGLPARFLDQLNAEMDVMNHLAQTQGAWSLNSFIVVAEKKKID
jgi:SAM-dependent methyltransferase